MVDPCTNDSDQLMADVDHLQICALVVMPIPLLRTTFHLRSIVRGQGQMLETTTSRNGARRDEVIQRQQVEGPESATRTLDSLVDNFGGGIKAVGIVASGPRVLDVVPHLELLEALGASIVDVLGVGNELGRRRRC